MSGKLELYAINKAILNDAIDRIVVKLHGINKKEGAKAFLCTGAGANGGTTTVAINIAISLAEAGWKTIFIDCDFRKDQKYKRIDGDAKPTFSDFLTGDVTAYSRVIHKTTVKNLDYVVAGDRNDNPIRLMCNARMESFISSIKEQYDFIIIDTPPIGITNDAEILIPYIDKYMIIACLNETTKKQFVEARIQLGDYEDKYIGVIANRMDIVQYKNSVKDYDYFTQQNLLQKKNIGMSKREGKLVK